MKIFLCSISFLILFQPRKSRAQESPFVLFQKAYATNDFKTCIENGSKVIPIVDHPFLKYQLAECYCQFDVNDSAILILKKLAHQGLPFDIENNIKLNGLHNHPLYSALRAQFSKNLTKIHKSKNAFTILDTFLIPEGITANSDGSVFYIGSLAKNKIIKKTSRGEEDFISTGQYSTWSVVGLTLSPDQKELWACSAGMVDSVDGFSGIFVFDVSSRKLKKKFVVTPNGQKHLFNDITFLNINEVYFTDSKAGKIWMITNDSLQPIPADFIYPNGITADQQRKLLYVADYTGVKVYDLKTKKITSLHSTTDTYLSSIDGLYFKNNYLIAIQNSGNDVYRIVKFVLDNSGTVINKVLTLQSHQQDFDIPTTGTIVNNKLYFIANSSLKNLQPNGTIKDKEKIKPATVKQLTLLH